MDGFAVRTQDIRPERTQLNVIEDIPAGRNPQKPIGPGQAARIMTGAPIPEGADAVIPVEETDCSNADQSSPLPKLVTILSSCSVGQYIRPRGQDISRGDLLMEQGHRLTPQDIGLLASAGFVEIPVIPRARIAIFSSGDELANPGAALLPGQIYDANQIMISSLLTNAGAEVVSLGIARDTPQDIDKILGQAADCSPDLIISTAGVSVGSYDFVRQRIEAAGELEFWRVNIRPGKPIAFGRYHRIPFVGLPGNPVSAFVTCLVFVMPAVMTLGGLAPTPPHTLTAILQEPVDSDGRESYLRAVVTNQNEQPFIRLAGHQGSANLFALTQANALLIIPSGVKSLPAGARVQAWLLTGEV
jgi:molybdopterin molybdotransferase